MQYGVMNLCRHIWRLSSTLFSPKTRQADQSNVPVPPTQHTEPRARVAYTRLYTDETCSMKSQRHLEIENLDVPLEEGQAKAVSYTWGEFNRRQVPIGHAKDKKRRRITIELGEEWTVSDVIERLAELSSSGPIWLDQLCIVQNDKAIRDTLAKIPAIFRTFPVVVLMPGRPCKCLSKFIHKLRPQDTDGQTDPCPSDAMTFEDVNRCGECLNFTRHS